MWARNSALCVSWQIVVNAIVDTLKTAFPRSEPQSPTDEVDAEPDGKLSSDKKSKYANSFCTSEATVLTHVFQCVFILMVVVYPGPGCDFPVKLPLLLMCPT